MPLLIEYGAAARTSSEHIAVLRQKDKRLQMTSVARHAATLTVVLAIAGCGWSSEGLWPSSSSDGESSEAAPETFEIPPVRAETQSQPVLEDYAGDRAPPRVAVADAAPSVPIASPPTMPTITQATPPADAVAAGADAENAPPTVPLYVGPVEIGPNTGTFVSQKVQNLRAELDILRRVIGEQNEEYRSVLAGTATSSQRYHAMVGAIEARLQVGTTPGNPVLVSQWQSAQAELDNVVQISSRLKELANRIAANSATSAYLVGSTRAAYGLQGAVEEDHRQLGILEDEVNRTDVSISRLLNEVNATVERQNTYLSGERRNLTALARAISVGESYGPSLSTLAYGAPALGPVTDIPGATLGVGGGTSPLVVIQFDRPDVAYEQPLYAAISEALAQRPNANFDLVAVTPARGSPSEMATASGRSKKNAERVLRALIAMGLPAERLNLGSQTSNTASDSEVHVFVR